MQPSPNGRRVGIRIVTFEACSGFTHVTARRIAQPPIGGFVTRLRSSRSPNQIARQLPDQSTILWVASSSTGDSRLQGALPFSDLVAARVGLSRRVNFPAEVVRQHEREAGSSRRHNETCSLVFVRLSGVRDHRVVVGPRFSCPVAAEMALFPWRLPHIAHVISVTPSVSGDSVSKPDGLLIQISAPLGQARISLSRVNPEAIAPCHRRFRPVEALNSPRFPRSIYATRAAWSVRVR